MIDRQSKQIKFFFNFLSKTGLNPFALGDTPDLEVFSKEEAERLCDLSKIDSDYLNASIKYLTNLRASREFFERINNEDEK